MFMRNSTCIHVYWTWLFKSELYNETCLLPVTVLHFFIPCPLICGCTSTCTISAGEDNLTKQTNLKDYSQSSRMVLLLFCSMTTRKILCTCVSLMVKILKRLNFSRMSVGKNSISFLFVLFWSPCLLSWPIVIGFYILFIYCCCPLIRIKHFIFVLKTTWLWVWNIIRKKETKIVNCISFSSKGWRKNCQNLSGHKETTLKY